MATLDSFVFHFYRLHTQTEENLKSGQVHLGQIEGELREIQNDVGIAKKQKMEENERLTHIRAEITGILHLWH